MRPADTSETTPIEIARANTEELIKARIERNPYTPEWYKKRLKFVLQFKDRKGLQFSGDCDTVICPDGVIRGVFFWMTGKGAELWEQTEDRSIVTTPFTPEDAAKTELISDSEYFLAKWGAEPERSNLLEKIRNMKDANR